MADYPVKTPIARCPSHPGALLEATGIRERKPVSPNIAARLGKMFGDGAAIWLRMQAAYDAWHAERDVDVSQIPTLTAA